jgi:hypothetical protein
MSSPNFSVRILQEDTIETVAKRLVDAAIADEFAFATFDDVDLSVNKDDTVQDVIQKYREAIQPPRKRRILAVSTDFEKLWELRDLLPDAHVITGTRDHAVEGQIVRHRPDVIVWDGTCRGFRNDELVSVSFAFRPLAAQYGLRPESLDWLLLKARVRALFWRIFFRARLTST